MDEMLAGCFLLQKLYGKQPENIEAVNRLFHSILGQFPADKVLKAFETWLTRSQEFPTPADIVNLIKRGGKPPLSESQYVAISRKDGEDRTDAEWKYLKDYEAERDAGWDDVPDSQKQNSLVQENTRLRNQIKDVQAENDRLIGLMNAPKPALVKPGFTHQQMIDNTVRAMEQNGAPQSHIEEFLETEKLKQSQETAA